MICYCCPQGRWDYRKVLILGNYCKAWSLPINTEESTVMIFQGKKPVQKGTNTTLGGDTLYNYNYLGLTASSTGHSDLVIKDVSDKA